MYAQCADPEGAPGEIVYNGDFNVPQYCDGTNWVGFGPLNAGAGSAGCNDPFGVEGLLVYSSAYGILQYCDGDDWQQVGQGRTGPAIPTDGLVGHWKFDEGSGTAAYDSSGNGNHGWLDDATWTTGHINGAVHLNNNSTTDKRVVIGHDDVLDLPNNGGAITAWIYPTSPLGQATCNFLIRRQAHVNYLVFGHWDLLLCQSGPSDAHYLWFRLGNASDVDECDNNPWASTPEVFPLNEWTHVVATWDSSTMYIYADGVLLNDCPRTKTLSYAIDEPITIGAQSSWASGDDFEGSIDDVRLYDRTLSPTEVALLYAYEETNNCSNPTGPEGALLYNDAGADQFLGPPSGCPNIGNVCSDGTIYAGISPDGNERMYVTTANEEAWLPFDQTSGSNGILTGMELCSSTEDTCFTGYANTEFLVELDDDGFGHAPFEAAVYCAELEALERDDWYLPSVGELHVLFTNENAIGDFADDYPAGNYGSSSESSIHHRWAISFRDGGSYGDVYGSNKGVDLSVRCVRRDGITDDGAPPEGGVMQYCNGAEWVAIGKGITGGGSSPPVIEDFEVSSTTNSTSLTLTAPSGITAGELLLIIIGDDDEGSSEFSDNVTGWTMLGTSGNTTADAHIAVYWRIADGGEGNVTVNPSGTGDDMFGWYIRVSGADTANPFDVSNFTQSSGNASTHNIPSVTTTVPNTLAIYGLSFDGADGDPYSISGDGWAEEGETQAGTGTTNASGAWGTKTMTEAGSTGAASIGAQVSDGAAYFQLAIQPPQ